MRVMLLSMVALTLPTFGFADDWPQWLGTQRDGVWRETGLLDSIPKTGPKSVWRTPIGPGYSGPAVANGRVYVMDRPTDSGKAIKDAMAKQAMPGSERVLCLDAAKGTIIWKHEYDCPYEKLSYPSGPRVTPLIHEGKIYTLGAVGHLFCFDEKDGRILWQKRISTEYKTTHPIWGYSAHPFIDGKKLITLVGGDGSAVVAFDKDSGNELWKALSSEEVCYAPPIIVTAGGKRQLIVWLSESLNGVDVETGQVYWTIGYPEDAKPNRPAVNIAQPLAVGDLVYVSSFYHGALTVRMAKDKPMATVVYRGKDKNPIKAEGFHALMATPIVKDGWLYGVGAQGEIRCVQAETGTPKWSSKEPFGGKDALFGTIFFVPQGDRCWLFTDQGDLILAKLTPEKYEEFGRAHVLKPSQFARGREVVWSHPAFAQKCMYARNDKEIICISLAKE